VFKQLTFIEKFNALQISVMLLFFVIFIISIVWALSLKKSKVQYMENLPFHNNSLRKKDD